MTRPLRLEFPGAIYHITSRGREGQAMFIDAEDREFFLATLDSVCQRFNWICHAYCLMDNHYHLMIETLDGNLSMGMRQLNGVYTQRYNRSYGWEGPVIQGCFKAILVECNTYLLEMCRYVVLNPVRLGVVEDPADYPWSSYLSTAGIAEVPGFLSLEWLLKQCGDTKKRARKRYREFVLKGIGLPSPLLDVRSQIMLGSPEYVATIKSLFVDIVKIKATARVRPDLESLFADVDTREQRNEVIRTAHNKYFYSLTEIGRHVDLHYASISKIANERM